jgi:hypothetical protein
MRKLYYLGPQKNLPRENFFFTLDKQECIHRCKRYCNRKCSGRNGPANAVRLGSSEIRLEIGDANFMVINLGLSNS